MNSKSFILSDGSSINSKGYRINIDGVSLSRFSSNPVMLKEHNPDQVIGRWENWKKEDNKLVADPVFDMDDPIGKDIARKVDNNFLRCASIGIIPLKLEHINDEFVMTESELVEASIVSIPSDSGAVRMYNDQMEELSFDQVKMNFNLSNNNQKNNHMAETVFRLSQRTVESLGLDAKYTPKDVELAVAEKDREIEELRLSVCAINETKLRELLSLNILTESEESLYTKMFRSGQTEVLQLISEKKQAFEEMQEKKLQELYDNNYDKIISCLTIFGWNEVKKLGYESAKKIVDTFRERVFFSKMIKDNKEVHNLDWYRKNNPKALQENPELRQNLLNAYKQEK